MKDSPHYLFEEVLYKPQDAVLLCVSLHCEYTEDASWIHFSA